MLTDVFISIVRPLFIIELSTDFPFSRLRQRALSECDRSAENDYSSRTHDHASKLCRGPFFLHPFLYFSFGLFNLNTVRYNHISLLNKERELCIYSQIFLYKAQTTFYNIFFSLFNKQVNK